MVTVLFKLFLQGTDDLLLLRYLTTQLGKAVLPLGRLPLPIHYSETPRKKTLLNIFLMVTVLLQLFLQGTNDLLLLRNLTSKLGTAVLPLPLAPNPGSEKPRNLLHIFLMVTVLLKLFLQGTYDFLLLRNLTTQLGTSVLPLARLPFPILV